MIAEAVSIAEPPVQLIWTSGALPEIRYEQEVAPAAVATHEGEGVGGVAAGGSGPDGTGPGGCGQIPRARIDADRTARRGRGLLQEGPPFARQHVATHPRKDAG